MKIFLIITVCLISAVHSQDNQNGDENFLLKMENLSAAVNQMKINVNNYSSGFFAGAQNPSISWPGGVNAYQRILWLDQLLYAGYIDTVFNAQKAFLWSYRPGKILDSGQPDDYNLEKNRIFRIIKGWEAMLPGPERDRIEKDYNEWPVEDGAPWVDVDNDGLFTRGLDMPEIIGDETIWYVYNDMLEPETLERYNYFKGNTFGLEFQVTIFGFNRFDDLGDVIFRKVKIINKGGHQITDFHLGYISAIDIGNLVDDNGGCDTVLNLIYAYNGEDYDSQYGNKPPAAGLMLLQGPIVQGEPADSAFFINRWIKGFKNNKMTGSYISRISISPPSWIKYLDPGELEEVANVLEGGKLYNGSPLIDPNTGIPVRYAVPGDPVDKKGWYHSPEGWKGLDTVFEVLSEVRMYMLMGSFNLAPFDTQEVVTAFIAGQGTDRLNSITELKRKCRAVKFLYENSFQAVPPVTVPDIRQYSQKDNVTLWWDSKAENYSEENKMISELNYSDKHYRFQGYIVKQYKDEKGRDPLVIHVYDNIDSLSVIEDYLIVNGKKIQAPVINGRNLGLRHYINITKDAYTGDNLYNGNPYYFSVQAYAVNTNSVPSYVISEPKIIEVIPGRDKIDFSSPYENSKYEYGERLEGKGEGEVYFEVLDPAAIDGSSYEVNFEYLDEDDQKDTLAFNVVKTPGDTLIRKSMRFLPDTLGSEVIDGSFVRIKNTGQIRIDSVEAGKYAISRIIETNGAGGSALPVPVDVFNNYNSTNEWMLTSLGSSIISINQYDTIKYDDYEIRFTSTGSEYYYFGNSAGNTLFKSNPKASGRVPFELWNVSENKRLYVKIRDDLVKDSVWSKDTSGVYERIYAYAPSKEYIEPIASLSEESTKREYPFVQVIIKGNMPSEGTVIKIETIKPFTSKDKFIVTPKQANQNDLERGKVNINRITAFPNPYFGGSDLERGDEKIIRFTGFPVETTIRIYTLAGVFVREIYKNDLNQYADWDLRTEEGQNAASGIYIAHIDMPGIGTKIIKLAIITGQEYLDKKQ